MPRKGENAREQILDASRAVITANGSAGISFGEVLKSTGLTKRAFFHYFEGKVDPARDLDEWHARRGLAMSADLLARAEAEREDPLDRAPMFLKLFEVYISKSDDPSPG